MQVSIFNVYILEFGTTLMNKHKLKMESNGER